MHFLTLPLFLLPTFAAVRVVWTAVNVASLVVSFFLVLRIAGQRAARARTIAWLAALWMGFQPLTTCLAQGNIEIVELMVLLAGLVALQEKRGFRAGLLVGVAAMIKYLPIGFLVWLGLRGFRKALVVSTATVGVVALCTAVTLGWHDTHLTNLPDRASAPSAGFHELSLTSVFLHQSAVLDRTGFLVLRWFPKERKLWAQRAGLLASGSMALAYAFLFWRRRGTQVAPSELGVLFLLMFLLPPFNHDYYYILWIICKSGETLSLTGASSPSPAKSARAAPTS